MKSSVDISKDDFEKLRNDVDKLKALTDRQMNRLRDDVDNKASI